MHTVQDGKNLALPDKNIKFSIVSGGCGVAEIRWHINAIGNCNVALETLVKAKSYTGELVPHIHVAHVMSIVNF